MSRLDELLGHYDPNAQYRLYLDESLFHPQHPLLGYGLDEDIPRSNRKVIKQWTPFIDLCSELWDDSQYGGDGKLEMQSFYSKRGEWVGCKHGDDTGIVLLLKKHKIDPMYKDKSSTGCSIGRAEDEDGNWTWYGWSHRACCGFTKGDMVYEEGFGDDETLFTEHGTEKIENEEQARRAASAFADSVS